MATTSLPAAPSPEAPRRASSARSAAPTSSPRDAGRLARTHHKVEPVFWWMTIPTLIVFTLAIPLPAVMGIFYSFTNFIGVGNWRFLGLANYVAMFNDPQIRASYLFTVGFSLVTVVVVNIVSFLLAVGLTGRIRAKVAMRTIFVIPMVISGIVIAYVFQFVFSNAIPAIGQALGIGLLKESLLTNPDLAWLAVVVVTAWQAIPGTLLIYIAGLMSVDEVIYEAADIDGASKFKQLMQLTLPLVSSYVVINTILGFKGFLNAYDIIVGLTAGGPGTSTMSVAMNIVNGLTNGDYAYQMANATVFFIFTLLVSLLQLSLMRGRNKK